ncbi:MAG: L-fucose isomerase, partial [Spirochaetota bacterium]
MMYQFTLPKIGIRPTIDGRRQGVRESLEEQTMGMAVNLRQFLEERLHHPGGEKVECVVSETCIGGVAESARCEQHFRDQNVGLSITVTPCWCYGTETIDMTESIPKAIWGFNGTARPGAVYLAAALAAHDQLGIPAFGIYGSEVQDPDDTNIPQDVQDNLLCFAQAGLAAAHMKGKSYLSLGSVSMGIAGSVVNQEFLADYLGMRTEFVDMSEIKRRLELDIYDAEEYQKALAWTRANCKEGKDCNPKSRDPALKEAEWETAVKMALIVRDLLVGNPRLAERGYAEEAEGHNAIAGGFQGQRHWTDFMPNGDFMEAILNSSFDWNGIREPFVMATENDHLNGISMLFGHLLSNQAQVFADVRTYWSPEAVRRVTGQTLSGRASEGIIHLINSGSASLDATGELHNTQG